MLEIVYMLNLADKGDSIWSTHNHVVYKKQDILYSTVAIHTVHNIQYGTMIYLMALTS